MSHPVRVRWQIVSDDGYSAGTEENQQGFGSPSQMNNPVRGIVRQRIGFWLAVGALALILWRICGIAPSQPVSVGPAIDGTAVTDSAPTAPFPVGNQEIMAADLRSGMAWVRVRQQAEDAQGPIRHSLFFAQTEGGWQPAAPLPGFWGAGWQQSGEYFVFHFRQRDRAAVEDALPLLDQRYPLLRRWLGLSALPAGEKVRVTVRGPEQDPPTGAARSEGISVPSPFLLSLPESVSDAEALVCSVILPLIDQSIAEALAPAPDLKRWQPTPELVRGLGLWGQWETCPLAMHAKGEMLRSLVDSGEYPRLTLLAPLHTDFPYIYPYAGVLTQERERAGLAFAALFAYASQRYGTGRVPILLRELRYSSDWHGMIPSVFDVSANEFEAGWRAWLVEEYGL